MDICSYAKNETLSTTNQTMSDITVAYLKRIVSDTYQSFFGNYENAAYMETLTRQQVKRDRIRAECADFRNSYLTCYRHIPRIIYLIVILHFAHVCVHDLALTRLFRMQDVVYRRRYITIIIAGAASHNAMRHYLT